MKTSANKIFAIIKPSLKHVPQAKHTNADRQTGALNKRSALLSRWRHLCRIKCGIVLQLTGQFCVKQRLLGSYQRRTQLRLSLRLCFDVLIMKRLTDPFECCLDCWRKIDSQISSRDKLAYIFSKWLIYRKAVVIRTFLVDFRCWTWQFHFCQGPKTKQSSQLSINYNACAWRNNRFFSWCCPSSRPINEHIVHMYVVLYVLFESMNDWAMSRQQIVGQWHKIWTGCVQTQKPNNGQMGKNNNTRTTGRESKLRQEKNVRHVSDMVIKNSDTVAGSCTGFSLNVLFPRYSHISIWAQPCVPFRFDCRILFCFCVSFHFAWLRFVCFAVVLVISR